MSETERDATHTAERVAAARARLHAQAATLVAEMDRGPVLDFPTVSADDVRAHYRGLSAWVAGGPAVDDVHDLELPSAPPIRLYSSHDPSWGDRRPLLVYLHSGGWVVGGLIASDERCRRLAATTGALVASVDYRLAPEHPYPAAIDDAWAATVQLAAHGRQLGADPGRIVLVGDSSGGNLAASVALRARSRGGPAIAGQVLLYPVLAADRSAFASARAYAHGVPLGLAEMDWYTNAYLGGAPIGPDVAPLLNEDLEGLPPSLVVGAECDLLCDEGRAYAERMSSAGVFVRYELFRGTVHGFFALSGALDDAARVTTLIAEYLQSLFGAEVDQIVPE